MFLYFLKNTNMDDNIKIMQTKYLFRTKIIKSLSSRFYCLSLHTTQMGINTSLYLIQFGKFLTLFSIPPKIFTFIRLHI